MSKSLIIFLIFIFHLSFSQPRFQPSPNTPDTACAACRLSFAQKLETATTYDCEQIQLKLVDLDTVAKTCSVDLSFYLPDRPAELFTSRFISRGETKKPKQKVHLVTNRCTFTDSPKDRFMLSDTSLQLLTLNRSAVENQFPFLIGFEVGKMCPTLYLCFELDENSWYFFKYECGVMKSVSSDERYNELLKNDGHKSCYSYRLASPKLRNDFLYRVSKREQINK